jgi:endonuclease/exonuclease/phosphatase family metal-dependent hydrolase
VRTSALRLLGLTSLLATGCRHAQPYLDPREPFYSSAYAAARAAGPSLRVVTFNIEYALRMDQAIAALRDHPKLRDADLITLQEMDAPGTDRVARALGLNYVYYPASLHPKYGRDVGNAVLTPWPIESSFKLPLPHRSRLLRQARAAVGAIVLVGDHRLRVYSVHLGSPFGASPGQRRDQLAVVLCHAREGSGPVVVAGDLNSSSLGNRLEADGYSWLTRGVGATTRRFSFDHVFVRGLPFKAAEAGVARDVKDASDHRPVWADLQMAAE